MKKILAILALCPALGWGWSFGSGGSVDYSRDAGNTFICASTATFTSQAGLSAATPVISLYNPPNSTKNLVLLEVGIDLNASPAGAAGFILAFDTGTVPAPSSTTILSNNGLVSPALLNTSTATATGICLLNSTLTRAPKALRFLGGTTGASAIGGVLLTDQTQGKIVVPPGSVIAIETTSAASFWADFVWREDNL